MLSIIKFIDRSELTYVRFSASACVSIRAKQNAVEAKLDGIFVGARIDAMRRRSAEKHIKDKSRDAHAKRARKAFS